MIQLIADDTKQFMNLLIKSETFDSFMLLSLELDTLCRFSVDGAINTSYLTLDEKALYETQTYVKWSDIKTVVATILKQSHTPSGLKLTLTLTQQATDKIIQRSGDDLMASSVKGFLINITFDGTVVKVTTGTNYATFTMNKSIEQSFDSMIQQFFKKNNLLMIP